METTAQDATPGLSGQSPELLEPLPAHRLDSTFQHRVNNVCARLIQRGVRPTFHRVRAHMGDPPPGLLREAMEEWSKKVLPTLRAVPKVDWAQRPASISPRIAELFEEMWLQAVSAAQIHHELGDDSSARLTHRETIEMVCHELRRVNTRVSCVASASQRLDSNMRGHIDVAKAIRADIEWFQNAFEMELTHIKEQSASAQCALRDAQQALEQQTAILAGEAKMLREILRIERARSTRDRRLATKLSSKSKRRKRITTPSMRLR